MVTFCPKCGACMWSGNHRCPPVWECRIEELHGEDWAEVHAHNEQDAAEDYAEQSNDEGDLLSNRKGWLVDVREPNVDGSLKRFRVRAEAVVNYNASEE